MIKSAYRDLSRSAALAALGQRSDHIIPRFARSSSAASARSRVDVVACLPPRLWVLTCLPPLAQVQCSRSAPTTATILDPTTIYVPSCIRQCVARCVYPSPRATRSFGVRFGRAAPVLQPCCGRHRRGCVRLPPPPQVLDGGLLDEHHGWAPLKPDKLRQPRQRQRRRRREARVARGWCCLGGGGGSIGARAVHALCAELGDDHGRDRIARAAARMMV